MATTPVIAEIMKDHSHFKDKEKLNDMACSLFTAGFALGEIVGPVVGDFFFLKLGWKWACNIVAGTCAVFGLLYLAVCTEDH
jgi:MFS family permease